ncbi:MAG: hypothetical protein DRJ64_00615 [Thermoprotei archaeon]|nr:MAG: hypothetical protein DRJ64_00615 [Thermoprotei archaeon]
MTTQPYNPVLAQRQIERAVDLGYSDQEIIDYMREKWPGINGWAGKIKRARRRLQTIMDLSEVHKVLARNLWAMMRDEDISNGHKIQVIKALIDLYGGDEMIKTVMQRDDAPALTLLTDLRDQIRSGTDG